MDLINFIIENKAEVIAVFVGTTGLSVSGILLVLWKIATKHLLKLTDSIIRTTWMFTKKWLMKDGEDVINTVCAIFDQVNKTTDVLIAQEKEAKK
jgi:hypothetical protein